MVEPREKIHSVRFDESTHRYLSVATSRGARVYHLMGEGRTPFEKQYETYVGGSRLASVRFNPTMVALVGSADDPKFSQRRLRLMDTRFPDHVSFEIDFDGPVLDVLFNAHRMVIVLPTKILVFDIHSDLKRTIQVIPTAENTDGVAALSQAPKTGFLAYPCNQTDGTFIIHDTSISKSVVAVKGHETRLRMMRFNPEGTMIATASTTGVYIHIFSVPLGQKLWTLRRGQSSAIIRSLSFSHDSRLFCLCSNTSTVHIFHLDPRTQHREEDSDEEGYQAPPVVNRALEPESRPPRVDPADPENSSFLSTVVSTAAHWAVQAGHAVAQASQHMAPVVQKAARNVMRHAPDRLRDFANSQNSLYKIHIQGDASQVAAASFLPPPVDPNAPPRSHSGSYSSRDSGRTQRRYSRLQPEEPEPLAGRGLVVVTVGETPAMFKYELPVEGDRCLMKAEVSLKNLPLAESGVLHGAIQPNVPNCFSGPRRKPSPTALGGQQQQPSQATRRSEPEPFQTPLAGHPEQKSDLLSDPEEEDFDLKRAASGGDPDFLPSDQDEADSLVVDEMKGSLTQSIVIHSDIYSEEADNLRRLDELLASQLVGVPAAGPTSRALSSEAKAAENLKHQQQPELSSPKPSSASLAQSEIHFSEEEKDFPDPESRAGEQRNEEEDFKAKESSDTTAEEQQRDGGTEERIPVEDEEAQENAESPEEKSEETAVSEEEDEIDPAVIEEEPQEEQKIGTEAGEEEPPADHDNTSANDQESNDFSGDNLGQPDEEAATTEQKQESVSEENLLQQPTTWAQVASAKKESASSEISEDQSSDPSFVSPSPFEEGQDDQENPKTEENEGDAEEASLPQEAVGEEREKEDDGNSSGWEYEHRSEEELESSEHSTSLEDSDENNDGYVDPEDIYSPSSQRSRAPVEEEEEEEEAPASSSSSSNDGS